MISASTPRTINNSNLCPCGSKTPFDECCAPVIDNKATANTPEELMRSRYTAYVLGESAYLLQSWDIDYRPKSITIENNIQWLYLEILDTHQNTNDEYTGYVTFAATSICDDTLVVMKEKSKFVKKSGIWFYQDGELHTQRNAIALNGKCPCGSAKKYKRCCRHK